MRSVGGSLIFLLIMFLVDFYVFHALKTVSQQWGSRTKWVVFISYWAVAAIGLTFIASLPYIQFDQLPKTVRSYLLAVSFGFFIAQLVAIPFFLADDLRRFFQWIWMHLFSRQTAASGVAAETGGISRSIFLSWLGLGVGAGLFSSLLYGFRNKYNYQVRQLSLPFPNLPPGFKGLKLVHISDIHSGSFMDKAAVLRGVRLINELEPDLILFTGDLVNDRASEMDKFMDVFSQLKAKMGVYSIFGNHDYGDYARWPSADHKQENRNRLKQIHGELGWRLLWDEHVLLERNGEKIALIGVQNISGRKNFHSYGNLARALEGMEEVPFRLLMSHDPSHWDAEVIQQYRHIDLTLSGHTHGMQFGVEIPGFRWSPVQWVYRRWAGLYEAEGQKLYVNRGFGFLGYPGRVGIMPEITLIELT